MDKSDLISRLNAAIPGAVIEKPKFGRTGQACLWIEMSSIQKVARYLKDEPGIEMDWLENLSVMQLDDALVLTYFLRSTSLGGTAILRGSVVPNSPDAAVDVPSVSSVWEMASLVEQDSHEMFGIRFGKKSNTGTQFEWQGYPLRKSYEIRNN